ncbi:WD repeat-containing protein 43 [Hordeum vulgare]|nr:WD repeat-containing protein 43 [Hordeum vulgare]
MVAGDGGSVIAGGEERCEQGGSNFKDWDDIEHEQQISISKFGSPKIYDVDDAGVINDFLNEFDDMPPEQEDDNKGEEDNMEEEDSMEEEEQEIKGLKRKRVFEGDSEPEDLFFEAEEEEEEGFVEPTPLKKLPIRAGPTTRSHCSSEDILEEDYVPLSDDGIDGEVDSDDEVVLYCSTSGRKLQLEHTCAPSGENCKIPARYVANAMEDSFRTYPRVGIDTVIDKTKEKFGVEVGKMKAYRARQQALSVVKGDHETQYTRIRDYLQAVLDTKPGSRCIVTTRVVTEHPSKNPRFHRLFSCLAVQRDGFLTGCRPFIGPDGCFVKLNTGKQILAATGRDGNSKIYPLAFGVVEKEDTPSWCWFLTQLKTTIGGESGQFGYYTIISDSQKGLLNAIDQIFPNCPQRYCLRHIYADFQSAGFRGDELKKYMDATSYSYTKNGFDLAMEEIRNESEDAWLWPKAIPIETWARKWDMIGIPCNHVVSAIYKSKQHPEDFVHEFFEKQMYVEAYKPIIYPIPGPDLWSRIATRDIDPPVFHRKKGRKQTQRRKGKFEVPKPKDTSRVGTITCSNCGRQGHRYTNCSAALKPALAARKNKHKVNTSALSLRKIGHWLFISK